MFNSVISTVEVKFMTTNLLDFYLNTSLKQREYVKLSLRDILEEIIAKFKLCDEVVDRHVYIKVQKGMYGPLQSGLLTMTLWNRSWRLLDTCKVS